MAEEWSLEKMIEERNNLVFLINNASDIKEKSYLECVLGVTDCAIREMEGILPSARYTKSSLISSTCYDVFQYKPYYSVLSTFYKDINSVLQSYNISAKRFLSLDFNDAVTEELTQTKVSKNAASKYTSMFFQNTDQDINEAYRTAQASSYVTFANVEKSPLIPDDCSGVTYFIDGIKKFFIGLYDEEDISIVSTLIHEYGHAVKYVINPKDYYSSDTDVFAEVPSLFLELLSLEVNAPNFSSNLIDATKFVVLQSHCDDMYSFNLHDYIYELLKKYNFKETPEFYKELKANKITRVAYREALNISMFFNGIYDMSYLVALELIHIYRKDKKEALRRFKEILKLHPSISSLGEVQEIVPLNVNAKDECASIVKKYVNNLK